MEFKKLVFFLTLFSINILQCADSNSDICDRKITNKVTRRSFSQRSSAKILDSDSLASFGLNGSAGSISDFEKNGQGSLAGTSCVSVGLVQSSDSATRFCVVNPSKEIEIDSPERCVLDPNRTEAKTKLNSHYQEIIQCSVGHPEVKEYMADLNRKTNQNIKNNLENAKIESRNIMAVLDGQEAPLKTHLKLAMAIAIQRGIKKILPDYDAERKREIKNFYRISHLYKMIGHIFPDIMNYCKDYSCAQTLDRNLGGHINTVWALTRLGENLFASVSDEAIKIWAINEKTDQYVCIQTIDRNSGGHIGVVWALTRLGKNLFASGSDEAIKIWVINEKTGQYVCKQTIDRNSGGHIGVVWVLTRLGKNLFASGSRDHTIKIWAIDEKTGQYVCNQTIDRNSGGHINPVCALTRLGKNLFASGSFDPIIKIWAIDEKTGQYVFKQTIDENSGGHIDAVWALTRLGKNLFVSGSWDTTIKIWQLNTINQEKFIKQIIKIERESLFKSEYSMVDAVDRPIWNECVADNAIEIQPMQEEQFCNKNISDNTIGVQPVQEKQSWLSWAWKNKYKIALGIIGAVAVYKIVQSFFRKS